MIVPARPLLWIAALVVVPLAGVAGLAPRLALPCAIALALCAAVAAMDAVAGLRRAARIGVRAPAALRLTKDVPAGLTLTIDNATGAPCELRIGIVLPAGVESAQSALTVSATPGPSSFVWPCAGRNRGDHCLTAAYFEAPSPARLWLVRAARDLACTLRVYPNLRDAATAALFLRMAGAGVRIDRQIGKGREFENLRQYAAGDSFEDIHWKATARRGYPAVKLYRVEHAQEVYAVIDHSRLPAREGMLDSFVDAALHLALAAERQGDRFGLIAFSDRTTHMVAARNGLDHFRACREAIYNLRAERVSPDFREAFTSIQLQLRRRALLVFFTALDDALLAESFERDIALLARRHLVLVNAAQSSAMRPLFTAEEPASLEALYSGLAGQMLSNRMRTLRLALGNRGVKLFLVDAANIKAQVRTEYADVKRRQAL